MVVDVAGAVGAVAVVVVGVVVDGGGGDGSREKYLAIPLDNLPPKDNYSLPNELDGDGSRGRRASMLIQQHWASSERPD